MTWERQAVMGIINVTPDSFYAPSRTSDSASTAERTRRLIADGADMIDIGAYSSRPGAVEVSPDEELRRLERGIAAVRSVDADIPVSVDTFRADIAKRAVTELGADIINDISGGKFDERMLQTVVDTHAPYILTHIGGTLESMHSHPAYKDVTADVLMMLSEQLAKLSLAGVSDVIIDPGFGLGKSQADNYQLLSNLEQFKMLGCPLLVGISNKSMIFKPLNIKAEESQNGTTVINTIALERGASILRVHDAAAASQAITLYNLTVQ